MMDASDFRDFLDRAGRDEYQTFSIDRTKAAYSLLNDMVAEDEAIGEMTITAFIELMGEIVE